MPILGFAVQWSSLKSLPTGSGAGRPLAYEPLGTRVSTPPVVWWLLWGIAVYCCLPIRFQTLNRPPLEPGAAGYRALIPACRYPFPRSRILLVIRLLEGFSSILFGTTLSQDTVMGVSVAFFFEILVLFGLTGKVEGVANARRRYLSSTQHLHGQSFS